MLFTYLPRFDFSCQGPASERQRRHIQQERRLLQRQPLLSLDRLNLPFTNKRLRLSLNHRFVLNMLNSLLPLFNLIKSLCASVRTRLRSCLPGNKFLLTECTNLDNSQITAREWRFFVVLIGSCADNSKFLQKNHVSAKLISLIVNYL